MGSGDAGDMQPLTSLRRSGTAAFFRRSCRECLPVRSRRVSLQGWRTLSSCGNLNPLAKRRIAMTLSGPSRASLARLPD